MTALSVIITCLAVTITSTAFAQTDKVLDGNEFIVKTIDGPDVNLETPQNLIFARGKADAPVCHMYGFYEAPYDAYEKDGVIYFSFTNESESEGKLVFNGYVTDNKIKGSYVWQKQGREDLKYDFEGQLN